MLATVSFQPIIVRPGGSIENRESPGETGRVNISVLLAGALENFNETLCKFDVPDNI